MATITKTQRWLDLLAFLVKRRLPVAVDDIMAAVPAYAEKLRDGAEKDRGAVRRMFERDKDELRELGVPLQTVPYSIDYGAEQVSGYRLASHDFYLPYLRVVRGGAPSAGPDAPGSSGKAATGRSSPSGEVEVTAGDAGAVADALTRVADLPNSPFADAARSALRKLAFDLDVDALTTSPVLFVDPHGEEAPRARIAALLEAVRTRKKASFTYHGIRRDAATERTVAPYGLLFQHGHWYLVGHDDLREDLRVFRLGRMAELSINEKSMKTPDYEIPDDFDLERYTGRRPWELGDDAEPVTARVRFEFPGSLWADRNDYGRLVEALAGGATVREFEVRQVDPFLRWVLSQAGEATIEGPPELCDAWDELVRRTARHYPESAAEPS